MAMLNFKYGLHKNLPAYDSSKLGTIFVTSDEHAMYVDLPDGRIRVSQIVTCTLAEWQALTPPYSTEAFYYIIDKNALLKYNGEAPDAGYSAGWVQINSTKAITDELKALEDRVKAIEDIGIASKLTSINGEISGLKSKDTTHEAAISALQTAASGLETKISGLGTAIGYAGYYALTDTLPTTGIDNNTIAVHGAAVKIFKANAEGGGAWEDYNDIVYQIEHLRSELARVEGTVASNATLTALQNKVKELEDWKATANTAITETLPADIAAALKAGTDAQGTADEAKGIAEAARDAIANTETGLAAAHTKIAGVKQTAENALAIAQAAVTDDELADAIKDFATKAEAQGYAKAVQGDTTATVKDVKDAIDNGETGLAAAHTKIAGVKQTAESALAEAQKKTTMAEVEAKDYATKAQAENYAKAVQGETSATVKSLEDRLDDESTGLAALANSIAGVKQTAEDAVTQGELTEAIKDFATDSELATAKNAILGEAGYTGTVKGAYEAAAAAKSIADGAASTANGNSASIVSLGNELDAEVLARQNAIAALEERIEADMQTADAMVFIDVVSSASGLPTTGVQNGWTYKANAEFDLVKGEVTTHVHIGDLLIASNAEGEDADLTWKHIPSGYVADYNPELSIANKGDNIVSVSLTSGVNKDDENSANDGDLGSFNLKAASDSAVTVKVEGTAVQIGMEWASFDPAN